MSVSEGDLDELAERAAEEIQRAREAGEHLVMAVTVRVYKVDRQRVS
jgi:hypothetical protein